jgi:hypothetical protein
LSKLRAASQGLSEADQVELLDAEREVLVEALLKLEEESHAPEFVQQCLLRLHNKLEGMTITKSKVEELESVRVTGIKNTDITQKNNLSDDILSSSIDASMTNLRSHLNLSGNDDELKELTLVGVELASDYIICRPVKELFVGRDRVVFQFAIFLQDYVSRRSNEDVDPVQ